MENGRRHGQILLRVIREHIPIALAYLGLAIIFTYPQITGLTTSVPQSPLGLSSDPYLMLWNAWWAKESLIDLRANPFFTDYLFYPNGTSLAFHELTLLNGIITIPFQVLLDGPRGLILGYNMVILLSFVLAGVGMFALIKHLIGSASAAFFGGVAFAFCPYRTMHIVHMDLLSMGWIPLYMLSLIRTFREEGYLNPIWAGLLFCATWLSCSVYAYFLLLMTGLFAVYGLLFNRKEMQPKHFIHRFALLVFLLAVAITPRLIAMLRAGGAVEQPGEVIDILSANLLGYLIPTEKHALYRFIFGLIRGHSFYLTGVPGHATFLTFTVIALAAVAVARLPLRTTGFWLVVFLASVTLSLGPRLHVWRWATLVPLPYALLYKFAPLFNVIRTPYRFVVLAEIGIVVLSCYGLRYLIFGSRRAASQGSIEGRQTARAGTRRSVIVGVFTALLCMELWNIPFRKYPITAPPVYSGIGKEHGSFAVLDLPATQYPELTRSMYYQTLHEKPIPIGVLSRTNPTLKDFATNLLPKSASPGELHEEEIERLEGNRIKYLIYHKYDDDMDHIDPIVKVF
ncbi:hypothetical protein HZA56_16675 [Candidatus Poribacteria bacterium]|nr:hypothetical protein [Candidatus Poribacteria bacterium]